MKTIRWAVPVLLFAIAGVVVAQPARQVSWKKIVIDNKFRSEGCAVADVNKDGLMDVLVGDFWYEAPDWKRHQIRDVKQTSPTTADEGFYGDGQKGYSECMLCWADDVNGDGYVDQIVIGFPGKPAFWYENPKGGKGMWKEHMIWHSACNETPQFVDLFGNGKRVLVMGFQPKGKQHEGQMAWFTPGKDPTKLWEMHPISSPSTPDKETPGTYVFSHGLGIGDLNGDGRLDVVCTRAGMKDEKSQTGGWWEQPAKDDGKPWVFHPADFNDACADLIVTDINGDGKMDIISSSAHRFGIWAHIQRASSGGHPQFVRQDMYPKLVSETHAMHFVDIDGDGLKDLITGKRFWSHGRNEPGSNDPARLYWFKAKKAADGMITYDPIIIDEESGIGTQFTVMDMNGDKKPDIAVANKKGVFMFLQQ